ncbi:sugar phosphate nucleotidyltransferase [Verrucomicrobiota bacterium sgz303538]
MLRTAFVLGAGLGTRLKMLTARRPKPLIPVVNKPLITYAFDHLLDHGVGRFVVNTHWRSEVYDREFPEASYEGAPIAFRDEQPEVLETAGGIKNVEDLLGDEPFIVYNGDILSTLPLDMALRTHVQHENEVTMVLRSKDGPLQVALDESTGLISDIGRRLHPDNDPRHLFSGIYIVSPRFLDRIPPATKISVIPLFIEMIRTGAKLGGVIVDDGHWWDLGNREQYLAVHREIAAGTPLLASGISPLTHAAPWIAPGAEVAANAQLSGATAIGENAKIGSGARLRDTIVWPGAEIAPGSDLTGCVVTEGARVSGQHLQADL